jgi:hypothetical protein
MLTIKPHGLPCTRRFFERQNFPRLKLDFIRSRRALNLHRQLNGVFMTLIKKSDVHRHLSTKSRVDREVPRPFGVDNPEPGIVEPINVPATVTNDAPSAAPGHELPIA